MGYRKNKMVEEDSGHFIGSDANVATAGGFLDVQIDNDTVCTVSIPMPNLMAERYADSATEWSEEFEDFEGNQYSATVSSSIEGVHWDIVIEPHNDGITASDEILQRLSQRINITPHYTQEG